MNAESAFYHAAVALAAGMAAQALASRLAVPSIVVLLATGAVIGPDILGLLDPTTFGAGRSDLVSLAVTVILFEGGLALDLAWLRHLQRSLALLLTLGAAISMLGGTLAAHFLLDMPWSIAALYGSLMIVTGPTVVTPLLSRITINRNVRELLVSEGVLVDPIGAIVAIVALDYVVGRHAMLESGWLVLTRLGVGGGIGVAAGMVVAAVLHRRWIADDLVNPVVLAAVLVVAAWTSRLSTEAGLMAAVAQGVTLANAGVRDLGRMREFKEALTVILLSFIFVVLAADLRLSHIQELGWPAFGVVAILAWVARPLAVFAATIGSTLDFRQRLFVAWICPRGIVAAAVAGLFRILLADAGIAGGSQLEALVFLTIGLTVTVQGLTARRVAHLLGVDAPATQSAIVVGADHLGRLLARLFAALGRQVVVIDRNPALCRAARAEGLPVLEGDALSVDTLEEAGARYAGTVVALTSNQELNALVIQRIRDNFRIERTLALMEDGDDESSGVRGGLLPGDFAGIYEVNRLLRRNRLRLVEYEVPPGEAVGRRLADLPYGPGEFALLVRRRDSALFATGAHTLAAGDRLWCTRPPDSVSALAALLKVTHEGGTLAPAAGKPAAR